MNFISTRNKNITVSGTTAIVQGIAEDGGLFVPESFPKMTLEEILNMLSLPYYKRSSFIMSKYLTEFSLDELTDITRRAYMKFGFETAPTVKIDSGTYALELWHGPTHAFKDIALTVLPYLLTESKKKLGNPEKTLILVATSGDTGKAALEGFMDVEDTKIMVLYPSQGVSNMQKLQMQTQRGSNVSVLGIRGNFDDAQNAAKSIFADSDIKAALKNKGYALSSANSINIGRLLPQVAYYFSAYLDLIEREEITIGDSVNFCVPSGNFGNILAGFYAREMGLPINKLICASNRNNVLTDFFVTGEYDANREFYKTISPSMDILISSNLERLIFELAGRNDILTAERMAELKTTGKYTVTEKEISIAQSIFYADFAEEEDVKVTLSNTYETHDYLCDPHTAVAVHIYDGYSAITDDETPTVILSTASPVKFAEDVLGALKIKPGDTPFKSLKKLHARTGIVIPESVAELEKLPVKHSGIVDKEQIKNKVLEFAR